MHSVPGKTYALAAVLAMLLLIGGQASAAAESSREPPPLEGVFAEDFTLLESPVPAPTEGFSDIAGAATDLSGFKGRVVLVNFWATWCAPCKYEMPSLARLQAQLEDRGFKIVALSIDRGGAKVVQPFMQSLELGSLEAFLDPKGKVAQAFAVTGLPSTYLIDSAGCLIGGMQGPAEWDSPEAVALIEHYLTASNVGEIIDAAAADSCGG